VRAFVDTDFPYLRQAVWDADWPRAHEGFARMAATCNRCHADANVAFVQVDAHVNGDTSAATRSERRSVH
jgi:hypothetical protein